MSCTQNVYKQTYCSWDTRRKLAEERVSRIDVGALAVLRAQEAALLRLLSGIMAGEQRSEVIVPLGHEVEPTLLHPCVEIILGDGVRVMKDGVLRGKNLYRSFLDRYSAAA